MAGEAPSAIDGLRARERLAVDLLARGKSCREVAQTLSISERTLYSWRQKGAVQRAIYGRQQDMLNEGAGQGITVIPAAVRTLTEIMNDTEARASDRIAASKALISGAQAYQERKMLERTIADLERQVYSSLAPEELENTDLLDPTLSLLPSASAEDSDE